jgi:hypothetical protein
LFEIHRKINASRRTATARVMIRARFRTTNQMRFDDTRQTDRASHRLSRDCHAGAHRREFEFVIATHSPIIMAYPDAWIYLLNESGIERVEYHETDHYLAT